MPTLHTLAVDSTYLSYALSTAPTPAVVSLDTGTTSTVDLTIVISNPNPDQPIDVSQITFNIPVGSPDTPVATDLAMSGKIDYAVADNSPADHWELAYPAGNNGYFTLSPSTGKPSIPVGAQGVVVTFNNVIVTTVVGTAAITISETATSTTPPSPVPDGTCTIEVPKFPYGFEVEGFALKQPSVGLQDRAVLTWEGTITPDTVYTMQYGTHGPVNVTGKSPFESLPLTETTTFILAVVSGSGSSAVRLSFAVTEVVENPDLVATSLQVAGATQLAGTLTVGGPTNATSAVTVTGPISANGGLAVNGGTTCAGDLAVSGYATVNADLSCAGAVSFDGSLQAGTTSINGDLTVSGAINATSIVMGGWTISLDDSGNLRFATSQGSMAAIASNPVSLVVGGQPVLRNQDPIYLMKPNDNTVLNASSRGDGFGTGWVSTPYWRNPPGDGDSNLQIFYGNEPM